MKRLRTALLGLAGAGAEYLDAITGDDQFELIALSDPNVPTLRSLPSDLSARTYEDPRSLIVETARDGLDLLVIALEPFESTGFVTLAAENGVNVFHKASFARTVREARRIISAFVDHGVRIVVERRWQFEPAFSRLDSLADVVGTFYAATASVSVVNRDQDWCADRERAGGGVLLNDAYEIVDMLIHSMGVPQSVYALCGVATELQGPRMRETEDCAVVTMRFGDRQVGCVTAVRGATASPWNVTMTGKEGSVTLSPDALLVKRPGSAVQRYDARANGSVAPAIAAFGAALLSGVKNIESTADRHLPTIATIEAAYLSAKTGAPEFPARLID